MTVEEACFHCPKAFAPLDATQLYPTDDATRS
jgi:hypothetical protein